MKYSAWFFIIVGFLMFSQWGFFLAMDAVPELQTEPVRILFHMTAEFATALCLIFAGCALRQGRSWGKSFAMFAAGMLAYTVMVSPGYFAQQGQWPLAGMFAVLLALDVASVVTLLRAGQPPFKFQASSISSSTLKGIQL